MKRQVLRQSMTICGTLFLVASTSTVLGQAEPFGQSNYDPFAGGSVPVPEPFDLDDDIEVVGPDEIRPQPDPFGGEVTRPRQPLPSDIPFGQPVPSPIEVATPILPGQRQDPVAGMPRGMRQQVRNRQVYISQRYSRYLDRSPTAAEEIAWIDYLARGASPTELDLSLLTGDEFYRRWGSQDGTWLNGLSMTIRQRPLNAKQVAVWKSEHERVNGSRTSIVSMFLTGRDPGRLPRTSTPVVNTVPVTPTAPTTPITPDHTEQVAGVEAMYRDHLGRQLSANELASWSKFFDRGGSEDDARAAFFSSREYASAFNFSDPNLITSVFITRKNRRPTALETERWLAELRRNDQTRVASMRKLLAGLDQPSTPVTVSLPKPNVTVEERLITLWYRRYLKREPNRSEMGAWRKYLAADRPLTDIQALILGSDEFYRLAGGTDATFLQGLHRALWTAPLTRTSMNGLNSGLIRHLGSRPGLARELIESSNMDTDKIARPPRSILEGRVRN